MKKKLIRFSKVNEKSDIRPDCFINTDNIIAYQEDAGGNKHNGYRMRIYLVSGLNGTDEVILVFNDIKDRQEAALTLEALMGATVV